MHTRMRTVVVLFVALAGLGLRAQPAPDRNQDEDAVRALVAKINQAWKTPEGSAILREVLSDDAFAVAVPTPANPGYARALNKETFCRAIDTLLRTNLPSERSHDTTHILVDGPIAYEISRLATRFGDGPPRASEQLNIYAKSPGGRRLVMGVSMDAVRKALAQNAKADEKQVRQLVDAYLAVARREKPVASLEQVLTPDFIQSTSMGTAHLGVAENMALYELSCQKMAEDFLDVDVHFDPVSIKMYTDSAIIFGKISFSGHTKDKKPWSRQVHETLVCARTPAGWRVTHEHSTVVRTQPVPDLRKK